MKSTRHDQHWHVGQRVQLVSREHFIPYGRRGTVQRAYPQIGSLVVLFDGEFYACVAETADVVPVEHGAMMPVEHAAPPLRERALGQSW